VCVLKYVGGLINEMNKRTTISKEVKLGVLTESGYWVEPAGSDSLGNYNRKPFIGSIGGRIYFC